MIQLIKSRYKVRNMSNDGLSGVRKYKLIYRPFTPEYSSHPRITGPPAKKSVRKFLQTIRCIYLFKKLRNILLKLLNTAFYAGLLISAKGYGEPSLVLFAAR